MEWRSPDVVVPVVGVLSLWTRGVFVRKEVLKLNLVLLGLFLFLFLLFCSVCCSVGGASRRRLHITRTNFSIWYKKKLKETNHNKEGCG